MRIVLIVLICLVTFRNSVGTSTAQVSSSIIKEHQEGKLRTTGTSSNHNLVNVESISSSHDTSAFKKNLFTKNNKVVNKNETSSTVQEEDKWRRPRIVGGVRVPARADFPYFAWTAGGIPP
jgi:hypothetical protein